MTKCQEYWHHFEYLYTAVEIQHVWILTSQHGKRVRKLWRMQEHTWAEQQGHDVGMWWEQKKGSVHSVAGGKWGCQMDRKSVNNAYAISEEMLKNQ